MAKELHTDDKLEYSFHQLTCGSLHFQVKAKGDAHVALTTGASESDPMYEVFLGGWNNTKSAIRRNRTKPDKASADTPDVVTEDEFRKFWIRWDDGTISVGKDKDETPFLSWKDPEPFAIGYFGIRTGWGAEGTWIVEDGGEIVTPDSMEYSFRPVSAGRLEVEVRCPHDAHLALTSGPMETEPMYEVFLGGWDGQESAIRYSRQKPDKARTETPSIVCDEEFRKFWIRWKNGHVRVCRDGEKEPFLEWHDPEPFGISHFGVRTAWGSEGCWRVKAGDAGATQVVKAACWIDATGGDLPEGAVVGGNDHACEIYVGRARHEGAVIPGKVVPAHRVCYIPWGGQEHAKEEYQVLCGCQVEWVVSAGGEIPAGALPGGKTEDGEPLFVGRVPHEGTLTVGKVHPSHATCYIPYGGEELGFPEYEVLVATS